MARFGQPCPHGNPPGTCVKCNTASRQLAAAQAEATDAAAKYRRSTLKARLMGEVSGGLLAHKAPIGMDHQVALWLVDKADEIVELILAKCDL